MRFAPTNSVAAAKHRGCSIERTFNGLNITGSREGGNPEVQGLDSDLRRNDGLSEMIQLFHRDDPFILLAEAQA